MVRPNKQERRLAMNEVGRGRWLRNNMQGPCGSCPSSQTKEICLCHSLTGLGRPMTCISIGGCYGASDQTRKVVDDE